MTSELSPSNPPKTAQRSAPWLGYVTLVAAGIVAGGLATLWYTSEKTSSTDPHTTQPKIQKPNHAATTAKSPPSDTSAESVPPTHSIAEFPRAQWGSANLKIEPTQLGVFNKTIQLTGKVSLNEDRIAHIYPMVEGTIDEVSVTLGQSVRTDDLLLVIHSREIGKAKLDLYQARLAREIATLKQDLHSKIADNTRKLLYALRQGQPIQDIEVQFRAMAMGDYRERLLAAYSSYVKSQSDVNRLEDVKDSGAVSGKLLLNAQANRNADLATFQARIEQIEYEMETELLLAAQAVKETETRVAVDATSLRILGCSQSDIDSIDPANQGEAISHYPIRAPFEGTVITKDCVLREQVRPSASVLTIADLSTVWITADVYEENVPLLSTLENQNITLTNDAWPGRSFRAKVFFTGEIMDEKTRTISLRAVADNSEHLLKPGMFVNVVIASPSATPQLLLPSMAIQEHEGKKFVFVHLDGDRFERKDILLGPSNDAETVILEGLSAGDPVVVEGGFILKSRLLAELMGEE